MPNDVPRRTAIIFDLDNCLAAADEVGQQLLEPVFAAVRVANDGKLSSDALDAAFQDCWVHSFDWVAERHHFTERMHEAGWSALQEVEVCEPMRGYGDLALLPQLGDIRFLVTSGFRRLQESKVRALGIASHFEAVVIDAVDEPDRRGKERIFLDLIERYGFAHDEVLVVGDNAESELAAADRLGLRRVQTLRPGVPRAANVTAYVHGLAELLAWLHGWRVGH